MFFFQMPVLPEVGLRAFDLQFVADVLTTRGREIPGRNRVAVDAEELEAFKFSMAQPGASISTWLCNTWVQVVAFLLDNTQLLSRGYACFCTDPNEQMFITVGVREPVKIVFLFFFRVPHVCRQLLQSCYAVQAVTISGRLDDQGKIFLKSELIESEQSTCENGTRCLRINAD